MFGWFKKRGVDDLEKKTQQGFLTVKEDIEKVCRWVKHLDEQDKQLSDSIFLIREDLSSIKDEMNSIKEVLNEASEIQLNKQLFKKLPVLSKQTTVYDEQVSAQTAVQTDNIYNILKNLSGNERLLILTLMNSEMKLSYEDLALLLGKERSTVRGQINSIKQKSEGLIEEMVEKNGKKRVFIPEETKKKMQKYAKVRVKKAEK